MEQKKYFCLNRYFVKTVSISKENTLSESDIYFYYKKK